MTTKYENVWPEYPKSAYWHDLIASPQGRPFYPFTRLDKQPTPPPVVKSRARLREEERRRVREAEWRERQLYYLNARGTLHVREGRGELDMAEVAGGEEQPTRFTMMAARYREFWQSVAACWVKLRHLAKCDVPGVVFLVLVQLRHLAIIAAVIGVVMLLALNLGPVIVGGVDDSGYVLEYVLAPRYRSWAIPQHECLTSNA